MNLVPVFVCIVVYAAGLLMRYLIMRSDKKRKDKQYELLQKCYDDTLVELAQLRQSINPTLLGYHLLHPHGIPFDYLLRDDRGFPIGWKKETPEEIKREYPENFEKKEPSKEPGSWMKEQKEMYFKNWDKNIENHFKKMDDTDGCPRKEQVPDKSFVVERDEHGNPLMSMSHITIDFSKEPSERKTIRTKEGTILIVDMMDFRNKKEFDIFVKENTKWEKKQWSDPTITKIDTFETEKKSEYS